MKVLLTSGIYAPDIGGPATFIPELAKALIEKNDKVNVITLGKLINDDSLNLWNVQKIPRANKFLRYPRTIFKIYIDSKKSDVIQTLQLIY